MILMVRKNHFSSTDPECISKHVWLPRGCDGGAWLLRFDPSPPSSLCTLFYGTCYMVQCHRPFNSRFKKFQPAAFWKLSPFLCLTSFIRYQKALSRFSHSNRNLERFPPPQREDSLKYILSTVFWMKILLRIFITHFLLWIIPIVRPKEHTVYCIYSNFAQCIFFREVLLMFQGVTAQWI